MDEDQLTHELTMFYMENSVNLSSLKAEDFAKTYNEVSRKIHAKLNEKIDALFPKLKKSNRKSRRT